MSRISRLVVLVTSVAAVVGVMAGTASAVTWHASGTGTFTATTGGSILSSTNTGLTCSGPTTAVGAYSTGIPIVNPIYTFVGSITFTPCLMAGQNVEVTCGYNLTATTQPVSTTITTGNADVTCGVTLGANGMKLCHISGAIHAIYHNLSNGADTVTFTTTSTLRVQGPSPALCPLGPNDTGHLNEQTFTITSNGGNGPNIVRTP